MKITLHNFIPQTLGNSAMFSLIFLIIGCTGEVGQRTQTPHNIDTKQPISQAKLKNLTLNTGVLEPTFDPGITEYTVDLTLMQGELVFDFETPAGQTIIAGTEIIGTDNVTLRKSAKLNQPLDVEIIIENQDGERQAYIFHIKREINHQQLMIPDGQLFQPFGHSVAVSNQFAVIGADATNGTHNHSGAVHIYTLDGNQSMAQTMLTPPMQFHGISFGTSVAISGDRIVVGAPGDLPNLHFQTGAAYVYRFDGTQWLQEAKLTPSTPSFQARFGASVAIDNNRIIVGSPFSHHPTENIKSGSAYIYEFDGNTWKQVSALHASDAAGDDQFGFDVAISGDLAVASAPYDDHTSGDAGSVYAFAFNGNTWTQEMKIVDQNTNDFDLYGFSVSLSNDLLVVGSVNKDVSYQDEGAVYVYQHQGTTWTKQAQLVSATPAQYTGFGYSVAVSENRILVGTPTQNTAQLFSYNGATWEHEHAINSPSPSTSQWFGNAINMSEDRIIVRARPSSIEQPTPIYIY